MYGELFDMTGVNRKLFVSRTFVCVPLDHGLVIYLGIDIFIAEAIMKGAIGLAGKDTGSVEVQL